MENRCTSHCLWWLMLLSCSVRRDPWRISSRVALWQSECANWHVTSDLWHDAGLDAASNAFFLASQRWNVEAQAQWLKEMSTAYVGKNKGQGNPPCHRSSTTEWFSGLDILAACPFIGSGIQCYPLLIVCYLLGKYTCRSLSLLSEQYLDNTIDKNQCKPICC